MFLFGLFPGMFQTAFVAGVQATVPSKVMGRVFASDEVGSYAFVPVGQYAGGLATFEYGIPATFFGAGLGLMATGASLLVLPAVGRFRFDPERSGAAQEPELPFEPPPMGAVFDYPGPPPSDRLASPTDTSS
jgi:hypothetical protein